MRLRVLLGILVLALMGLVLILALRSSAPVAAPSWTAVDRSLRIDQASTARRALAAEVPEEPRGKAQAHTHVAVRLSAAGSWWPAPENLGLTAKGESLAIHTHDSTGVVHLHRPRGERDFSLRQLLAVWGIDGKELLGRPIAIQINGRPAGLDSRLKDRDDIVLLLPDGPALKPFAWKQVPLGDS